jgi:hypothetical protein
MWRDLDILSIIVSQGLETSFIGQRKRHFFEDKKQDSILLMNTEQTEEKGLCFVLESLRRKCAK